MDCDIDKLNEIAKPISSKSLEQRKWRMDNKRWLSLSAKIALKFRKYMKDNDITREKLAEGLGVSLTEVDIYLSGRYNFDLKTIANICSVREWLGKELPIQELLEIAYKDDKENNK